MKQVIVLLLLLLSLIAVGCQPSSTQPPIERYKIYYSPHAAQFTYLLDTQSGDVWLLIKDSDGDQGWQKMKKYQDQDKRTPKHLDLDKFER